MNGSISNLMPTAVSQYGCEKQYDMVSKCVEKKVSSKDTGAQSRAVYQCKVTLDASRFSSILTI